MKRLTTTDRIDVYNAPTISWNNDTYTPISNKFVMDMVEDKIRNLGLVVKNENYIATKNENGSIKGVIGTYDIATPDEEFGQRIMFRNSYDKSMSFAFVAGTVVWICTNGCIKGNYQYKRIHRGTFIDDTSSTKEDVVENIDNGFKALQTSFDKISSQLRELKHYQISPSESYDILGQLFFEQQVISINQLSIIKREFERSVNFRHIGDSDFTAYDLYNHITESLKTSHPLTYISDHVSTHALFEKTFNV